MSIKHVAFIGDDLKGFDIQIHIRFKNANAKRQMLNYRDTVTTIKFSLSIAAIDCFNRYTS